MSLLKKLFGGAAPKEAEPETYKGFSIFVAPQKDGANYRIAGRIEKEVDGTLKTHNFLRADTFNTADTAADMTLMKAKQLIDQMGERLF
ncbi:HlyU family transcriptional regulator [Cognatishimia sp. SS12]|uniref:HlyU family transcriptional regulator n=1 Tax=Cognatishimia sp. SS12 TaxID=2979465 RepID=UPI00233023C8|nr:HlyU family transcriptional regulator [Cognatishimia sp. SS12]MDC0736860.1 HlyU family transcriptional regulator [Cognatishimia sp. SS12]